jgi:hypothetical protein
VLCEPYSQWLSDINHFPPAEDGGPLLTKYVDYYEVCSYEGMMGACEPIIVATKMPH